MAVILDRETGIVDARLCRPPHNFLDAFFLEEFCDALIAYQQDPACRCIVISAEGRNFCAGRDFSVSRQDGDTSRAVYAQAVRLMAIEVPIITTVQGAAVGAGMGLAMVADFRLCSERAYFAANFVAHGLHHGFGLSTTLPRAVGPTRAMEMLLTGRRYAAAEALAIGLVSEVVDEAELPDRANQLALSIAANPAGAVRSIRRTMRTGLVEEFTSSIQHECDRQAERSIAGI